MSWSSLIAGYAQSGQADVALNLYQTMKAEGVMPDSVTFITLLNAGSHVGLVEEGEKLFDEMFAVYILMPTLEHYTCMIDLFGRAGHFDKAGALLDKVPHSCHLPLFSSILGGGMLCLGDGHSSEQWSWMGSVMLRMCAWGICMRSLGCKLRPIELRC